MLELAGKGALLVGTRRIGQVVARRLAQEGINLAIAYRSSRDVAERLHREIASQVQRSVLVQGDLSDEEDVQRIMAAARQGLGDISFVVNMASGYPHTPFASLDGRAWDVSMADARGSYLLAVYAARAMMDNPGATRGHIIMFSDWAARETPYQGYLPYLTSKAAIHFMASAFAVELAQHGILVNAIAPGPTMRPPEIGEQFWQRDVLDQSPLRRESSAEEMAEVIVTLLRSETITGETVRVDSGRHLAGPGVAG